MWPNLFKIEVNFGYFMDGRIIIKVEDMSDNSFP